MALALGFLPFLGLSLEPLFTLIGLCECLPSPPEPLTPAQFSSPSPNVLLIGALSQLPCPAAKPSDPLVTVMYASDPSPWWLGKGLSFPLCRMEMQTFALPSLQGGGDLLGSPVEADEDAVTAVSLLSEGCT